MERPDGAEAFACGFNGRYARSDGIGVYQGTKGHALIEKETSGSRLLRLLLYVEIGLVLATFLFFLGWYGASKGINVFPMRWIGLCVWSVIVFWYSALEYKRYWHRSRFWLVLFALLTFHVVAFVAILRRYQEWRLPWFIPSSLFEGWIIILVLEFMLHHKTKDDGVVPQKADRPKGIRGIP
jgi:hypothetical protein